MIALICLFFPAILGVGIYEHLRKISLSAKGWLYRFCTNTVIINAVCFVVKRLFLHTADEPFYTLYVDTTPTAALNYLIMAVPVALVLVFLQVVLAKHATVTVEEKNDD